MKKLKTLLLTALLLSTATIAFSQSAASADQYQDRLKDAYLKRAAIQANNYTSQLELNDEQSEKVESIFYDHYIHLMEARNSETYSREMFTVAKDKLTEKIKAVLTEDQLTRFNAYQRPDAKKSDSAE